LARRATSAAILKISAGPINPNKIAACQFALIGLLGCRPPPTDVGCLPHPMPHGVAQTVNPTVGFYEMYADGPQTTGAGLNRHCAGSPATAAQF